VKHIDEYREKSMIVKIANLIIRNADREYSFMEVCGGHTAAIHRFGILSLLPDGIKLLSGPGCPVCVTSNDFIDKAIEYSRRYNAIITTFGDLIRVPGSDSTLEMEMARGGEIRIVLSGLEALRIAKENIGRKVIFLGIGFETTAPGTAVTIMEADREDVPNFYLLSAHKVMPPVMEAIIKDGIALDGFICPGHVAAITGSSAFSFITGKYNIGCVITGFEPVDILHAILMLVKQVNNNYPKNEIQYSRVVTEEGNLIARRYMNDVFLLADDQWRGFGTIAASGLKLRERYERFDAEKTLPVEVKYSGENVLCICGEILRGLKKPAECTLFGGVCTPENPVGACMVSSEGACNTFYRYRLNG
jgi:hydrogenase expression/formation protein HypD